ALLLRDMRDSESASRHPALDAAGWRRLPPVLARCADPADGVLHRAPAHAGDRESLADLDRLHRLDAHQRLREHPVDTAIPMHVRTEPGRDPEAEHLDDPAERIPRLRRLLDLPDHLGFRVGIAAPHFRAVDRLEVAGTGPALRRRGGAA